jgi:hypothetical protein
MGKPGIINQPPRDIERRIVDTSLDAADQALIGSQISSFPVLSLGLKSSL